MDALIVSGLRAMRSLFNRGMLRLFILTVLLTIAALVAFVAGVSSFCIWLSAHMQNQASAWVPYVGGGASAIIAWLLFPGIMPVIVSFFDERIARAIEEQEYPAAPAVQTPAFLKQLLHDARFTVTVVILNILVLPLYLLPVINLFLFYALNGYLLGREFFVMAARRHLPVADAEALRRRHNRTVFIAGVLLTVLATIPILNLFAPFWGIAIMVHLYHRLAATA